MGILVSKLDYQPLTLQSSFSPPLLVMALHQMITLDAGIY
nr:MAG TPA: hypothetical protein [Caudoviricetes sp.]